MQQEPGDEYLRRLASFIRTNEKNLAEGGFVRRRRPRKPVEATSSAFNPLAWFGPSQSATPPPKPVILSLDTHRLFYILMRLEAIGIDVGTLDVQIESPSRPMSYVNLFQGPDRSDTLSLSSIRSSLSAVSGLSLGAGWWSRPEPPSVDSELKYIYSCFTKLPALAVTAPGRKVIAELANESPNRNALPLDAFKNLQTLECTDIDPRTLLGWDRLAESLRVLTIKRSGLEDISDAFIGAVVDDQARRGGSVSRARRRLIPSGPGKASYFSTPLPESVAETSEESTPTTNDISSSSSPPPSNQLSSLKWAGLKRLSLSDNALTFLPTEPLQYLTSITHLDLSSNLLVSIPACLSILHNLVSLNLSDNMIDSVLGIYTHLGQVLSLNLSRNRLESICGLERLLAIERIDLRHNLIDESLEVGRLATLPNIVEVWVEGNPFVEVEENYRVACFDYFSKEGKAITLDGSLPGFYEKRNVHPPVIKETPSYRSDSTVSSPPVVAVRVHHSPSSNPVGAQPSANQSPPPSVSASPKPAGTALPIVSKQRRNIRIVQLDGDMEHSDGSGSRSGSHARYGSDSSSRPRPGRKRDISPAQAPPPKEPGQEKVVKPTAESTESTEPTPPGPQLERAASQTLSRAAARSRHSRHHTDYAPASPSHPTSGINSESLRLVERGSATVSGKSNARRARATASVYEPPTALELGSQAELYRQRMESLRSDMGDAWLKVFSQSQMGSTGVASG